MSDTPRTDAFSYQLMQKAINHSASREAIVFEAEGFARQLEREQNASQAKLSTVFQWINRNHPDGFIDSLTHLQNLERVTDLWHEKLDAIERRKPCDWKRDEDGN